MLKTASIRRFAAVLAVALLTVSPSVFGEDRSDSRTNLRKLAEELRVIFGPDAVEIREGSASSRPSRRDREQRTGSPQVASSVADEGTRALLEAMNRRRAAHGLDPLELDRRLNLAAADRAADMFALGYFDHVSPDGRSPFLKVTGRGYRYRAVGENLAAGYRTAEAIVDGWMRSPGHRANILSPQYSDLGVAVRAGAPVRGYGGPTVVALYAAER